MSEKEIRDTILKFVKQVKKKEEEFKEKEEKIFLDKIK